MAVMFKRILAVALGAALTIAAYATAQELRSDHPTRYVVQKGDTLWDIAARFLKQPWLWPEIWQANPQIANPHLIYPGDVISLAYLEGGRPVVRTERGGPEIRRGPALTAVPLSQVEPFLRDLRVLDNLDGLPYVVATEEDGLYATPGELVHARGMDSARPGDMYAVVRLTVRYTIADRMERSSRGRAEDLDFRGRLHKGTDWGSTWRDHGIGGGRGAETLGYEVMTQSLAQVTRAGDPASLLLIGEGREVREGDLLLPVLAQPYDLEFLPRAPDRVAEGARVLSVADSMWGGGPRYVVALSVGARDGVANGQVFSAWTQGARKPDRVKHGNPLIAAGEKFDVPDDFNGHVMVFRTFDRVSYGLVMNGIRPVMVGDTLKQPDEFF